MTDGKQADVVTHAELLSRFPCLTTGMVQSYASRGGGGIAAEELTTPVTDQHKHLPGRRERLYVVAAWKRLVKGERLLPFAPSSAEPYIDRRGTWVRVLDLVGKPFGRATIERHLLLGYVGGVAYVLKEEHDTLAQARGYRFNERARLWTRSNATPPDDDSPTFQTAEEFAEEHKLSQQVARLCAKSRRYVKCVACRRVFRHGGIRGACPRCGGTEVKPWRHPLVRLLGRPIDDRWEERLVGPQRRLRRVHVYRRADGELLRKRLDDRKTITAPRGKVRMDSLVASLGLPYPVFMYHAQRGAFDAEKALDFGRDGKMIAVWFVSEAKVREYAAERQRPGNRDPIKIHGKWYLFELEAAHSIGRSSSQRSTDAERVLRGVRSTLRKFRNKPCTCWGNIKIQAVQHETGAFRSKWGKPWVYRVDDLERVRLFLEGKSPDDPHGVKAHVSAVGNTLGAAIDDTLSTVEMVGADLGRQIKRTTKHAKAAQAAAEQTPPLFEHVLNRIDSGKRKAKPAVPAETLTDAEVEAIARTLGPNVTADSFKPFRFFERWHSNIRTLSGIATQPDPENPKQWKRYRVGDFIRALPSKFPRPGVTPSLDAASA